MAKSSTLPRIQAGIGKSGTSNTCPQCGHHPSRCPRLTVCERIVRPQCVQYIGRSCEAEDEISGCRARVAGDMGNLAACRFRSRDTAERLQRNFTSRFSRPQVAGGKVLDSGSDVRTWAGCGFAAAAQEKTAAPPRPSCPESWPLVVANTTGQQTLEKQQNGPRRQFVSAEGAA